MNMPLTPDGPHCDVVAVPMIRVGTTPDGDSVLSPMWDSRATQVIAPRGAVVDWLADEMSMLVALGAAEKAGELASAVARGLAADQGGR